MGEHRFGLEVRPRGTWRTLGDLISGWGGWSWGGLGGPAGLWGLTGSRLEVSWVRAGALSGEVTFEMGIVLAEGRGRWCWG